MNIQEFSSKIKLRGREIFVNETVFLAVLLAVVAISSFALGKYSVASHPDRVVGLEYASTPAALAVSAAPLSDQDKPDEIPQEESEQVAAEGMYVGSKNSNKYHLPWCSGAKTISAQNKIWFASKEEAEAKGYVPAGNCKGI